MHSQNVAIDMQNAADILLLLLSLINEQNMLMSVVCTPQVDRRPIIKQAQFQT